MFFRINEYFCPSKSTSERMNYEELLASRNAATMKKDTMPFGFLYKKKVEKGYANTLDLRHELSDSLRFCELLKAEAKSMDAITNRHQLHFQVTDDSSGLYSVTIEQGNCRTFERLIEEKPAVVANKDFVEKVMKALVETATVLNDKGIYHLCYAPSNILVRKGDDEPLLLFHGSSYLLFNDQEVLYGDSVAYVAPEVLEDGVADARSEVYSLGLFMKFLYRDSDVPYEYRSVIKKATQTDPAKRYASPSDMLKAMSTRRSLRSSLVMGLAAAFIALLGIGLYVELVPSQENVDFVEAAPHEDFGEEMYPDDAGPVDDLSDYEADSTDTRVDGVDEKEMKVYEAKAEQIFRKRYAAEADRILSKIYNNEHMNSTEKKFFSESNAVMEELTRKQMELGDEAGLSDIKSQRIASEIIERISNEKKKQMEKAEKSEGE